MIVRYFVLLTAFLVATAGAPWSTALLAQPQKSEQTPPKVEKPQQKDDKAPLKDEKASQKDVKPQQKDDKAPTKDEKPQQKDDKTQKALPLVVTDGSVIIAGQKVEYKATAGTLPSVDKSGKAKANIFFVAYTRKTGESPASRRLTFCFNGGPGSASAYVHLGFFGPRRVLINDDGLGAPRPVQMVENDCSILDVTDLVFIDPVSTGLSRPENASEAVLFHGLEEDTQSVGNFIRDYVAKYERKESPTYIAGESYGTTRAASLSSYVQRGGGVKLAGIVLISAVLDFQTISFGAGNDVPYALFLPTYTATAYHHGKLDKKWATDLPTALKEAQKFADGPYLEALHKGNLLSDYERQAAAKQIAMLTGLSEDFVLRSDLRVEATRFRNELLRDQQVVVGRLDTRLTAKFGGSPTAGATGGGGGGGGGRGGGGDPSNSFVSSIFSDAMRGYLADGLGFKTDVRYQLTAQVQPWSFGQAGTNRYANVAPRLRSALEKDKSLRVLVASGYCDLATPFGGTNYTFAHLGPRALMDQVTMTYYDAGHMLYTHEPSRRKLRDDLVKFMASAAVVDKKQ
jgi:carboxypeptidase C (cathepsin A)